MNYIFNHLRIHITIIKLGKKICNGFSGKLGKHEQIHGKGLGLIRFALENELMIKSTWMFPNGKTH